VLAIGVLEGDGSHITIFKAATERETLWQFIRWLREAHKKGLASGKKQFVLVGYRHRDFDLPALIERCKVNGIPAPFFIKTDEQGNPIPKYVAETAGLLGSQKEKLLTTIMVCFPAWGILLMSFTLFCDMNSAGVNCHIRITA